MSRKMVSAYVETEVDVDLDNFDQQDIIDYLEEKGYTIIEGNVNSKYETFEELDNRIWQLYLMYISCNGAGHLMDKELGDFFAEYYNKVSA
jgi:hypothetical protein